jgi:hypothetical protein
MPFSCYFILQKVVLYQSFLQSAFRLTGHNKKRAEGYYCLTYTLKITPALYTKTRQQQYDKIKLVKNMKNKYTGNVVAAVFPRL